MAPARPRARRRGGAGGGARRRGVHRGAAPPAARPVARPLGRLGPGGGAAGRRRGRGGGHEADGRTGQRRVARRQHPRDGRHRRHAVACDRWCPSRCCASAPAARSAPRHRWCRRRARSGRGWGARRGLDRDGAADVTITGMAAGFTVLFGAPLGGAVFALEILHRRGLEYYEALMPAVIGSLCGYGVYVGITGVGLEPVWQLPAAGTLHAGGPAVGRRLRCRRCRRRHRVHLWSPPACASGSPACPARCARCSAAPGWRCSPPPRPRPSPSARRRSAS